MPKELNPSERALHQFQDNRTILEQEIRDIRAEQSIHDHNWFCRKWRFSSCQTLSRKASMMEERLGVYRKVEAELLDNNPAPVVDFLRREAKKVLPTKLEILAYMATAPIGLALKNREANDMWQLAHDLESSTKEHFPSSL